MHPLLLLLLASSLLLLVAASADQSSSCWPKACGTLNITYPFWLEEPGQPACGPPSFQLKCNGTNAFLVSSVLQAYRVVSIFTHNNSVRMVDQNLPLATGCPAPTVNISLPGSKLLSFSKANKELLSFSKANKELLYLGKCTGSVPEPWTGFRSLPCDNHSFVRLGDGRDFSSHGIQGGVPPGCLFTVVPIFWAAGETGDDYLASMRNGFLLEWSVVPEDCPRCMASGGECVYSPAFSCNCSGSLRRETCAAPSRLQQRQAGAALWRRLATTPLFGSPSDSTSPAAMAATSWRAVTLPSCRCSREMAKRTRATTKNSSGMGSSWNGACRRCHHHRHSQQEEEREVKVAEPHGGWRVVSRRYNFSRIRSPVEACSVMTTIFTSSK